MPYRPSTRHVHRVTPQRLRERPSALRPESKTPTGESADMLTAYHSSFAYQTGNHPRRTFVKASGSPLILHCTAILTATTRANPNTPNQSLGTQMDAHCRRTFLDRASREVDAVARDTYTATVLTGSRPATFEWYSKTEGIGLFSAPHPPAILVSLHARADFALGTATFETTAIKTVGVVLTREPISSDRTHRTIDLR